MFMAGNLEVSPNFATLLQETSTLLWGSSQFPRMVIFGPKRFKPQPGATGRPQLAPL